MPPVYTKISCLHNPHRPLLPYHCRNLPTPHYVVHSTITFPGSRVSDFAGNSRARKLNKAQTKRVNITCVQYFHGLCYCLRTHQQEWCQLRLIIYPLFITFPHYLRQLPFSPPPPPRIERAATDRVCLHQRQNTPAPWFGRSCESI